MSEIKYAQIPRWQVVVLSLLDLGGATEPVKTEDVTVQAWQKAPTLFCLNGYPEHPDMYIAERALRVARSDDHGILVMGDKRGGWRLSPAGLKWIKQQRDDGGGEVRPVDHLPPQAVRMLRRLNSTSAYRNWQSGNRRRNRYLLPETLELPVDSPQQVIQNRLDAALNAADIVSDQELEEFLRWLGEYDVQT